MKIVEKSNNNYEYEFKDKDELLEILKDYVRPFLPEFDDLANDIFENGEYDLLIGGLDSCYKNHF